MKISTLTDAEVVLAVQRVRQSIAQMRGDLEKLEQEVVKRAQASGKDCLLGPALDSPGQPCSIPVYTMAGKPVYGRGGSDE